MAKFDKTKVGIPCWTISSDDTDQHKNDISLPREDISRYGQSLVKRAWWKQMCIKSSRMLSIGQTNILSLIVNIKVQFSWFR